MSRSTPQITPYSHLLSPHDPLPFSARFCLDYQSILAIQPRIVYCSITGYGQDGPYASRPGFDAVFQAHGGIMSVTGIPDGEPGAGPMKTGPSLMDVMTGYNAVAGILAALLQDRKSTRLNSSH